MKCKQKSSVNQTKASRHLKAPRWKGTMQKANLRGKHRGEAAAEAQSYREVPGAVTSELRSQSSKWHISKCNLIPAFPPWSSSGNRHREPCHHLCHGAPGLQNPVLGVSPSQAAPNKCFQGILNPKREISLGYSWKSLVCYSKKRIFWISPCAVRDPQSDSLHSHRAGSICSFVF